jgi:hypothetical protein
MTFEQLCRQLRAERRERAFQKWVASQYADRAAWQQYIDNLGPRPQQFTE